MRSLRSGKKITESPIPQEPSSNSGLVPFADDPLRGGPIVLTNSQIDDLNQKKFLTTTLIDYVLRHAVRKDIPDDTLIGSSNCMSYFEMMNKKKVNSSNSKDAESAKELR